VQVSIALLVLFAAGAAVYAQTPDFSGLWKQANDPCQPKRNGDVILHIEHHDSKLAVETSISRGEQSPRHAEQNYTTDGEVSISTGADGDEFHTSVVWRDSSLVFRIEEHEDGRIIRSKETWTLIEGGGALQRIRERADDADRQTLIYLR
jgi:hypothetical protein